MLELEDWVKQLTVLWNRRLDALDRVLEAEKRKLSQSLEGNTGKGETQ
jgi:hypothetical protein